MFNNFKSGQGINKQDILWKVAIVEKRETTDTTASSVGLLRETMGQLMPPSSCHTGLRPGEQLLGHTDMLVVLYLKSKSQKCFANFSFSVFKVPIKL